MRPSHRNRVLDVGVDLIERHGIKALTIDAVAREAQMTKSGVLYHFPSRAELVGAIQEHLAQRWETRLGAAAGKPPEEATVQERLVAYVHAAAEDSARRTDLSLAAEGMDDAGQFAPWAALIDRWTPSLTAVADDGHALDLVVLRLAADGLWMNGSEMSPELRARIADRISTMVMGLDRPRSVLDERVTDR